MAQQLPLNVPTSFNGHPTAVVPTPAPRTGHVHFPIRGGIDLDVPANAVCLVLAADPQAAVRLTPKQGVDRDGRPGGPLTLFAPEYPRAGVVALRSIATGKYLGVAGNRLTACASASEPAAQLTYALASGAAAAAGGGAATASGPPGENGVPPTPPPAATLTTEQAQQFYRDGFLVVRNSVAPEAVNQALRKINNGMGRLAAVFAEEEKNMTGDEARHLVGGLRTDPDLLAVLYRSTVWSLAEQLLGPGNVRAQTTCQIAMRFPALKASNQAKPGTAWHIDGMNKGALAPFSILCGFSLSDQPEPLCGNLVAFPGTHLSLAPIFKDLIRNKGNKPTLNNPHHVLLNKGDCVILHPRLAHQIGAHTNPNNPNPRIQLYMRLNHIQHRTLRDRAVEDMWVEFEGIRNVVAAEQAKGA